MSNKIKLLLVEDETILSELLLESLEMKGFEVFNAANGEEGLKLYNQYNPDVCIFDVMMPVMSGFTLLEKIRKTDTSTPILILTAKALKDDIIRGLELGADDYLTKPFSFRELHLRLKNILKRKHLKHEIIDIGEYVFNYNAQILSYKKSVQQLTSKESELLYLLYLNRNEVIDRKKILKDLWGNEELYNYRSIDVFISKLRKYLDKDKTLKIISIRNVGYKMVVG